jgi:anti-sigma factor RsiW
MNDDDDRYAHLRPQIDCEKLVDLLTDYVDGELPKEVHAAMDQHIAQCGPCVNFMREYRFSGETARRVLLQAVPDGLEERLLSFLKGRCKKG